MENEEKINLITEVQNFLKNNKKKVITSFALLIIALISFIFFNNYQSSKNEKVSEKFIQAEIYLSSDNKEQSTQIYKEIILSKNKFYSLLALNEIIDNDLVTNNEEVLRLFKIIESKVTILNKTVNSSAVIVAIPPALRQKITFSPGLNGEYRQLLQRSPMGSKFKVFAVYAEAFWREEGYCGAGRGNLQYLEETADSGPVESNPGIMVSFVAGNKAAALNRLSDTEQRRLILEDFVRYLGPKAAEPLDLVVQRWIDEQWTTGGYTAFRTPGAWTGFGTTWQQPHGRIFWAGTEESTRWPGYFEGAIEAGIQAVDRAAAALDGGGN